MLRAAGIIFLAKKTGRVLLNLRSDNVPKPSTLGFFGGKMNNDENLNTGLSREITEEIGFIPTFIKSIPIDVYSSPDNRFQYYSYIVIVEDEFIPQLNAESDGYIWCNIGKWPRILHPGAKIILNNKSIIKAIQKLALE